MSIVHMEVQISPEALLKAVDQLSPVDLERFVTGVLTLHAQRRAPHLPPDEAGLLRRINQGIPEEVRERYEALIARRRAGALAKNEHAELLRLTGQVEAWDAERLSSLANLARLRGVSLDALMESLGIQAPTYE